MTRIITDSAVLDNISIYKEGKHQDTVESAATVMSSPEWSKIIVSPLVCLQLKVTRLLEFAIIYTIDK